MQHCTSTIFHGDQYCGDCGETLKETPLRFNVGDLYPEILEDIRQFYPDAKAISGKVLESQLYKRRTKSSSQKLDYSFWWIKLETKDGDIIETSISAESEYTDQVSRGTILTLYYPSTCTLNYKIVGKEEKKLVKNNEAAPCVIMHNDNSQSYSVIAGMYPKPARSMPWFWIILSGVVAYLLNQSFMPFDSIVMISLGCGATTLVLQLLWMNRKYKARLKKYQALEASLKALVKVTKFDLGYFNLEREKKDSDIICISCNQRLPSNLGYCIKCGQNNEAPSDPLLEENAEHGMIADAENLPITHEKPDGTARLSVNKIQQYLADTYAYQSEGKYTHHHVFEASREATVNTEFMIARVASTSVSNNVSDKTYVTTTTTETKHYKNDYYTHSSYDTKTSEFRNRNSTLSGTVVLEYVTGEVVETRLAEGILGSLDVGDWIALADSSIKFKTEHDYNLEFFYNITKSHYFNYTTFVDYSDQRGFGLWKATHILLVAALAGGFFMDSSLTVNITIGLAAIFNTYAIFSGIRNAFKNSKQRKAIIKPLQNAIEQFEKAKDKVKQQVDALG